MQHRDEIQSANGDVYWYAGGRRFYRGPRTPPDVDVHPELQTAHFDKMLELYVENALG